MDALEILEMLLRGDICDDPARIRRAIAEAKVLITATFDRWEVIAMPENPNGTFFVGPLQ